MSLSFPTAPTIGQMVNGLIWDGVKWTSPFGPAGLADVVLEVALRNIITATPASTYQVHKYDTVITDRQNAYVPATGLFTPRQAGLYLVTATVSTASNTGNDLAGCLIVKNGNPANAQSIGMMGNIASGSVVQAASATALIFCNGTTDTIAAWGKSSVSGTFYPGGYPQAATVPGVAINMVATLLNVGPQGPAGTISPGNLALLSTVVISSPVATIDFLNAAWFTNYDELEMTIVNLTSAGAESTLFGTVSPNGTTWDTGANYHSMYTYGQSSAASGGGGTTALGGYDLLGSTAVPISASYGALLKARFFLRNARPGFVGQFALTNSANNTAGMSSGLYTGAAVQGLRLRMQSGSNLTRGTIKLYGVVK